LAPAIAPAENIAELTGFEAQLDAAVRAAAAMPEAARRQHRTGGARLRFRYLDGAVDEVQIVESSQSRLLDDAAITAVRAAHYPAPPVHIRGRRLELLVRIDFRLDAAPG
jgi:TonB family protein